MEIAEVTTTGTVYDAHEFRDLAESERAELRDHLICVSCRADAYYIRPSRNGRPACFGARPHNEPCEQASQSTDRLTVEDLSESEQRAARSGGFRLQAADGTPVPHNQKDDPPTRRQRGGHAYTQGDGSRSGSLPGLKLDRLLRLIVSKPGFAESASPLHLDSGTITSVREYCVPIGAVDVSFRGRERIYWGTVRFPVVDDDGAWLNTGSRAEPS
ncbi:hypothetical protein, partial [Microbacterium sp.]|uniref:hypothetical protein n=1 Tax=Microbacterium sp. TaxID=51671 RepID=UPI003A85D9F2